MPIATSQLVIQEGNLPTDTPESLITGRLSHAEKKAKELLGSDIYAKIKDPQEPYAATDKEQVGRAEALICLSLLLPALNVHFNEKGGMIKTGGFGDTEYTFISQNEAEKLSGTYKRQAYDLLSPYVVDSDTNVDAGSFSLWAV